PDVEEPFGRDLGLGPVPPRAALLGTTELVCGERAFVPQASQHFGAALVALLEHVPTLPLRAPGPTRHAVGRPVLERYHTCRVGPVLKRRAPPPPVGPLDPGASDSPETGVGDQLVRPGQHRDRVELYRAEPAQHRRDAPAGPWPAQTLGEKGDPTCVLDAEGLARDGH